MSKSFTVEVKITIADDADPVEVMDNMDYSFNYEGILDTEIIDCVVADEILG